MIGRITSDEVTQTALRMRAPFLLPFPIEKDIASLLELSDCLPGGLKQPIEVFCASIRAIHATTTFPYLLASSKASAIHFQRYLMAERIRNLKDTAESRSQLSEKAKEKKAYEIALRSFNSFQSSDEGMNALVQDLSSTLLGALANPGTAEAADELLFQAVVSIWSSFEVFVRDQLTLILNGYPRLAQTLLNDAAAKKTFELPKITIEELSSSRFDLSNSMGSILFGSRDFSDIRTIKIAVCSICDEAGPAKALNNNVLWTLNQRRHLIVHRRGIVDQKYVSMTSYDGSLGDRINIAPADVETYFDASMDAVNAILLGLKNTLIS